MLSLAKAQTINSPYSRYGVGDLLSSQNILNRGMGGISAAYYDYSTVNFINPASYGRLQATTFDFGLEVNNLSISSSNPPRKYSNASPIISYMQLGIPFKKSGGWGMVIGLRPISRINYKIERRERLLSGTINDSALTLFEGTGGSQVVYVGTGFNIKNLSIGFNTGYLFGTKDYSTRLQFLNDTILYQKANYEAKSSFGGLFLNAGLQYTVHFSKKAQLQLGAHGSLQQNLNANRDLIRETFEYSSTTGTITIDSVFKQTGQSGTITLPRSFGVGFLYNQIGKWIFGMDYTSTQWSKYRYFDSADKVQDSWLLSTGAQLVPSGGKNYWSNVAYRAGFSIGKDYVNVDRNLNRWSFSFGFGLPMRRAPYSNQFSVINTAFEFGQRGNNNNLVRENFFRVSVGLTLSDIWFLKRQYN